MLLGRVRFSCVKENYPASPTDKELLSRPPIGSQAASPLVRKAFPYEMC